MANDLGAIVDMSYFHHWQTTFCMVVATPESLKLLLKHGKIMAFMDGTYRLVTHKMQVVSLVVMHTNGKVTKKYFYYYCESTYIVHEHFLFCCSGYTSSIFGDRS